MPPEAIEIVRRAYQAYEADGVEGIITFLDPAIEWRNPSDSPIAGVFRGHDGVREWFRLADEAFAEIEFRPEGTDRGARRPGAGDMRRSTARSRERGPDRDALSPT